MNYYFKQGCIFIILDTHWNIAFYVYSDGVWNEAFQSIAVTVSLGTLW